MTFRSSSLALLVGLGLTGSALAQTTFPEIEPNSQKSEATAVNGIVSGDLITGTSTGGTTTLGDTSATSADTFRVKTGAAPLGIYLHTLTVTSATAGNAASIRGVTQTAGAPNPGTDATLQGSNALVNKWYGFGKQEEVYYRVTGTTASTAAYAATLATSTVAPLVVPGLYNPGPITVTTVGQGHTTDTEIYLYDGNLDPVPLGHNDDIVGVGIGRSTVNVTLVAGTYYVAVANFNTANDQGDANPGENFLLGNLLDFPNAMTNDSTTTGVNVGFQVSDGGTTTPVAATRANAHEVVWATFTVQVNTNPPANDNCASAQVVGSGTFGGILTFATNDGAASCDSGGAASKDVWYSFTAPSAGDLSVSTCGTGFDTVVSVLSSCGGSELGCNDNCGGSPCGGPASCLGPITLAAAQTVLIRVSDKGTGGGLYTLNIGFGPAGDNCAFPIVLPGPGTYPFDTTNATAGQTFGSCSSVPGKNLWFQYTANVNGSATVDTCNQITGGTSTDTEIWVYQGAGCPSTAALGCNDDGCGLQSTVTWTVTCGTTYMIEIANFSTTTTINIVGTFTLTETGTACATPSTPFCDGSGVGTSCLGCGNNGAAGRGCANSSFAAGSLLVNSGISSVSADTMTLTGSDMTGPGLFFQATGLAGSPITFGDGMLCASVGIIRMGVVFPTAGVATYPGGLTPAPISSFGATSGATLHYQCWYRDAVAFCTTATFNLTNGLSLTWAP